MLQTRFKEILRRLKHDDRAVSPVIAFVLMFALVMIVFTLYQTNVVPAQNQEVEFDHSQTVEKQLSELNDAIGQVGASGVPQSMTVATGVQYPDRALAINPGNPVGTLATSDPQTVTVSGLSGDSGYWNDDPTFDTRLVTYRSNYNVMQQEPTYSLENGMRVAEYESATLLRSDGSLLSNDGQRIDLVLVGGDYRASSMTASVTATPVSTSTSYHQLESDGSATITLPTTLPEDEWVAMLSGKSHASLGPYDDSGAVHSVTIDLDSSRTYDLRVSKVALGGSESPDLTYLGNESNLIRNASLDTPEELSVSARDEFGNLYTGGATVEAAIVGDTGAGAFVTSGNGAATKSPNDGRATFSYRPAQADADSTVEIELTLTDENGSTIDTTIAELTFPPEDDEDNAGASIGVGDIDNGYTTGVVTDSVSNEKQTVELTFENIGNNSMTANRVRVNGFLQKSANSASPLSVSFNGTSVQLNGNITPLDGSSEYTVPPNGTRSVTLDFGEDIKKGGFLIISVEYKYNGGETDTATYAVAVTGS